MKEIQNKYYLYCHSCNGDPFYIGVGSKRRGNNDYSRAYCISKSKRNRAWFEVYSRCTDFNVCIFEETNSKDQISFYEKAYIWELGRKHIYDDGYLVNIQSGGYKTRFSYHEIGKYDLNGNLVTIFTDVYAAAQSVNLSEKAIYQALDKKATCGNFIWKRYEDQNKVDPFIDSRNKQVYQYDFNGNLVNSYISASEAGRITNIDKSSIIKNCLYQRKSAGKFIWSISRFKQD